MGRFLLVGLVKNLESITRQSRFWFLRGESTKQMKRTLRALAGWANLGLSLGSAGEGSPRCIKRIAASAPKAPLF